jgi:hypothetical protein
VAKMADRKVYVTLMIDMVIDLEEGVDLDDVLGSFTIYDTIQEQDIPDFEIVNSEITDSK